MPGENLTRIEAQERRAIVDTRAYDVQLDLTRGDEVFTSRTTVTFAATEGASTFIDLIARTVHSVTLNGRSLDPASVFADSRIALEGLAPENELVVEADCEYTNTGEGLHHGRVEAVFQLQRRAVFAPGAAEQPARCADRLLQRHAEAGVAGEHGGLVTTVLEMAFAGHCGLDLHLDPLTDSKADIPAILFNEELGHGFAASGDLLSAQHCYANALRAARGEPVRDVMPQQSLRGPIVTTYDPAPVDPHAADDRIL